MAGANGFSSLNLHQNMIISGLLYRHFAHGYALVSANCTASSKIMV